jgi:hypothetical protein
MKRREVTDSVLSKLTAYQKAIREALYGFTGYELHLHMKKEKGYVNHLFMLVIFGDLAGLPLLPPYYALRLLPYIVPEINAWKRSILREKDITDILVE